MTQGKIGRICRLALLGTVSSFAFHGNAMAQGVTTSAPQRTPVAAAGDAIIVTGTRIRSPGLISANPVTSLDETAIARTGVSNVIDILAQLPQSQYNVAGSNNQRFINGSGVSFVNLRGLGEYRTLTLIDGVRQVGSLSGRNGSGGTLLVDTNTIAPALIERVDIVTGGESAIYGADAIAGVVNFIMKKNFHGMRITARYGAAEAGGSRIPQVSAIFGADFAGNRGNITVGADFQDDSGLFGSQRNYALCNHTLVNNPANTGIADGIPDRISIACTKTSYIAGNGALVIATPIGSRPAYSQVVSPNGLSTMPFNRGILTNPPANASAAGDSDAVGGDGVNQMPYQTLRSPNRRLIINTLLHYDMAKDVGPFAKITAYADLKFAHSYGTTILPPISNGLGAPSSGPRAGLPISIDNPFIPSDLRAQLLTAGLTSFSGTRFNQDWYPRTLSYDYQYIRTVFGVRGDFKNNWNYDVYYNYGRNSTNLDNSDRIAARFRDQIDVISVNGTPVCRSAAAQAAGCAPINPFVVGPLTSAQYDYSGVIVHERDVLSEYNAAGSISGNLFQLRPVGGSASKPVQFAAGVEWRKEVGNSQPDPLVQKGLNSLNQIGAVVGRYSSREAFAELSIPLAENLPLAKSIDLSLAARYQHFSTSGNDWTWNVRGTWAISDSIKLRGGIARAVRAPNIDELFSATSQSFAGVPDPCSIGNINSGLSPALRAANCAKEVPAGYNQNNFANATILVQGNRNLRAEVGITKTAGIVLTPTAIRRLSLTLDYWQADIKGGIQNIPAGTIAANCYDTASYPANPFCPLLVRGTGGALITLRQQAVNVANEHVRGFDLGADYAFDVGAGRIGLHLLASYLPRNTVEVIPDRPTFNIYRAGAVGFPKLKGLAQMLYSNAGISASWTTRYIGSGLAFPHTTAEVADYNRIAPFVYNDLALSYKFHRVTLSGGVNNVFNKKPPQVPFFYSGSKQSFGVLTSINTGDAAATYSNQGRFFYGGLSVDF